MEVSRIRYKANLGKGMILHFKILKDELRVLNNQPFYYIVSALEHTIYGFKPTVWGEDVIFQGKYFNSISRAEESLYEYFLSKDIKLEKGVELVII